MPLQQTSGAASYDAFGGGVPVVPAYIEDVFSTYLYTGNGSTQTITNGIALGTASGGSVFFGGNPAYLNLSAAPTQFGTGDFTVETWINPTAVTPVGSFIELSPFTGSSGWAFGVGFPSSGVMYWYTNGANLLSYSGISVGVWTHVAVSRSGSTNRMFVNGALVASATDSTNYNQSGATNIGADVAAQFFRGNLSNLRVVKGTALYTSAFTPPTEPLTVVSGTSLLTCQTPNTVQDYSSNAYSITNNGAIPQNGGGPFTDATAGKGGLVWFKRRSTAISHALFDSARSSTSNALFTNTAGAQVSSYGVTFNSNGVSLGQSEPEHNSNGETYASWTFRKQPKFFDVVTWTGTGSNRTIAHALGSVPGCIIVKRTNTSGDWMIYHRSIASTDYYNFAYTGTPTTDSTVWNSTPATSSVFSLGTNSNVNASGGTYVAYVFAHNAGGFGLTGTDNVITCGSFTTDGSGNATVNLGYEPQFVMLQRQDDDWFMNDSMRGMPAPPSGSGTNANLLPNSSNAESINGRDTSPTSTGFVARMGSASKFCIYIAIRRGPMKVPTSGTSVYNGITRTATNSVANINGVGFPPDICISSARSAVNGSTWFDKLRGPLQAIRSPATTAEATHTNTLTSFNMDGISVGAGEAFFDINRPLDSPYVLNFFKRAPSFFDEVCWTADSSGTFRTISHGLSVAPELIIYKRRDAASDWNVYHSSLGNNAFTQLNTTGGIVSPADLWNYTTPTSTSFTVGYANTSPRTYVAYLFATCAGVSKVFSYTGNGSSQTINCGFTSGARFVLIKRTDSSGDWYVWDSARGIVSGNDPHLSLNTTAAEVTTDDTIDTDSTGFVVNQVSATNVNVSSATYIGLAIA